MDDSVAVDAKRILLRYGAPIDILDSVSEEDRISFARIVARTSLPDRGAKLNELLIEKGYISVDELNQALPPDKYSSEQIEDEMARLNPGWTARAVNAFASA